jgi:peptide/nickel transport system ATP-binding protein
MNGVQSWANAPVVLTVDHLSVDYILPGNCPAHALHDVNLCLRKGEILGIVGESGCGKSTLMLSLMRLLPANAQITQGSVRLLGQELLALDEDEMAAVRWKNIAIIFQGAMNALNPVRTVGSQIREPVARHKLSTQTLLPAKQLDPQRSLGSQIAGSVTQHEQIANKSVLDRRVAELLNLVGIHPSRRSDYPHQFSGGMRQRAMIAMALACLPEVIIADEPTTALDVMVQAQILDLLLHLREQLGLAVLFVTHDLGVVAEICDSVMVMYAGTVAESGEIDAIYNEPHHPYTQQLLAAFPDINRPQARLASIPGAPPRLDALPPGCRFAPRCPVVFDRCHEALPPLYPVDALHAARCYLLENPTP